jgi:hypothetical protein
MNLFYPVNKSSKACWVFDSLYKGWPQCKKVEHYKWDLNPSAFWGLVGDSFNLIKRHQKQSVPFLFTDMPYWNRYMPDSDRKNAYWRVIPNNLHCNWIQQLPNDRIRKMNITVKDWSTKGSHILVCPSSATIERFYDQVGWTERTIETLKKYTDRPIKIRHKPRNNITSGPAAAMIPLEEDLRNAHAIVSLVSIAAVDAVAYGIPSFASKFSPAAPVSCQDLQSIESPLLPDRQQWINTLSYHQYTEAEIASGSAFEFLGRLF